MIVDSELINRCQENDIKAMEVIYIEYAPILLGICLRYIKDRNAAEDVMQDTFITIFTKIKQFEGKGSFEGWIKKITVNTALIQLRKNKKEFCSEHPVDEIKSTVKDEDEEEDSNLKHETLIANTEFSEQEIMEAISLLPIGYRTVLNLYVMEGYKHKEISKLLDISVGTSKSQLLRARKKLEHILYKKALNKIKQNEN